MRVLITGANGQLGKELVKQLDKQHYSVFATSRIDLDITKESIVETKISQIRPDIIIHAAAYTDVDQAEFNKKTAFEVNALGAFYVAREAKKIGAKMVYISSDYVFSGDKSTPYNEDDPPNPISVYGASKWLGERLVRSTLQESYIIRTSWLYGHGGNNFVKTMINLAKQQKEIKVVNDQVGSPTYTKDLVEIIHRIFNKGYGIYHVSNNCSCSWYEFAREIFLEVGNDPTLVISITTKEYGAATIRPSYSVMECKKLKTEGIKMPRSWQSALHEFMKKELAK
ncbi:dTDP-4-dehydrorhamnose reductase [Anaerobacillus alkalilacustris]|uniref:dTDP-4-dehydrorhamnose reductase n=1 Tax=Anaerobacillus alkalilacustris TaxID=393763 RepID=A0A1S2LD38_9BACI|nr:dTDP-4-dehydrorhamnose reductase [Anaerobacillus alkalilacustris]OIJ10419.1 dTDP-4-dehydrorhamnose reductase [Anaerobacillus alkalilacustris]